VLLGDLGRRQLGLFGDGVDLVSGLVSSLRLQFQLGFAGVVAVGTSAIFLHLQEL
jgi:hypothetical protein